MICLKLVTNREKKMKCEEAEKHGDLCLGFCGDTDEPCEQCKNCIKCENGYYQLGEVPEELIKKD